MVEDSMQCRVLPLRAQNEHVLGKPLRLLSAFFIPENYSTNLNYIWYLQLNIFASPYRSNAAPTFQKAQIKLTHFLKKQLVVQKVGPSVKCRSTTDEDLHVKHFGLFSRRIYV
jgi:hypothetical protein